MRYVGRENNPPPALADWKKRETIAENRHYEGSLETTVKDAIRDHRVVDQGYICAYTLQRIARITVNGKEVWNAHVEHVTSQESSRENGRLEETVDYANLVACVDYHAKLPYGAAARGSQVLPINPLHENCAQRFRFRLNGEVEGLTKEAKSTVEILQLNHASLVGLRQARIGERGLGLSRPKDLKIKKLPKPALSVAAARRLAEGILSPDPHGRFTEFFMAIAHAAEEHAKLVEHQARKLTFARRNQA